MQQEPRVPDNSDLTIEQLYERVDALMCKMRDDHRFMFEQLDTLEQNWKQYTQEHAAEYQAMRQQVACILDTMDAPRK